MNVLIIGGVAASTKAAAKIKRLSPDAQVTILTKGRDISYAGCGLPYYVGGLIEHKEELIVNTPAKFTALTGANVLVEREVTALLPQSREAVAKNLRTGAEERYSFDECIIASGASSIIPPLPGVSLPGVFTIRTPQDAIDLREYLEQQQCKACRGRRRRLHRTGDGRKPDGTGSVGHRHRHGRADYARL